MISVLIASLSKWLLTLVASPRLQCSPQEPVSVSKAKKAITLYKKAIGQPQGLAELAIFYCEEAFSFLEGVAMKDEGYFFSLIRMYSKALSSYRTCHLMSAPGTLIDSIN
jgi:hypothetical protein